MESLTREQWTGVIGTVAALCTTLAFVPYITKILRQGGRGLSYGLLGIYVAGVMLWLGYGLLIGAWAVIAANAASTALVATAILLKRRTEARTRVDTPPKRRLRIAIDMDDVIADTRTKAQRFYRDTFGEPLNPGPLESRSSELVIPPERRAAVESFVLQPGFFADLDVVDGSREVVRELAERYEVFIATAAMEVPTSFADKYAWLRRHFSFLPPSHYVFCGDKSILDADVLIDDTPRQFKRFRGRAILFSTPHNQNERAYERVSSWKEVRDLLLADDAPAPIRSAA